MTAAGANAGQARPDKDCKVEYAAVLDLADVARRYGPSAGVFLDALGDLFDQLQECLDHARTRAHTDGRGTEILNRMLTPPGASHT
jgi:hypothetical protein